MKNIVLIFSFLLFVKSAFSQTLHNIFVDTISISPEAILADSNLTTNHKTYRILIDIDETYDFDDIVGNINHPLIFHTTTSFYNFVADSTQEQSVNKIIQSSTLEYDSWVSSRNLPAQNIRICEGSGIVDNSLLHNFITDSTSAASNLSNNSIGIKTNGTKQICIGQFTTNGYFTFELNIILKKILEKKQYWFARNPICDDDDDEKEEHQWDNLCWPNKNNLPSISISSPDGTQGFYIGETVPVKFSASDTDGNLAKLELYVNGKLSDEIFNPEPNEEYTLLWTCMGGEKNEFAVVAIDNRGGSGSDSVVSLTTVVNSLATTYDVDNITVYRGSSEYFCLPIRTTEPVEDVIGYSVEMEFDENLVYPTNNTTVAEDLIENRDWTNTFMNVIGNHLIYIITINGSAPAGTTFNGSGELACHEFMREMPFQLGDSALFTNALVTESYTTYDELKSAYPGYYTLANKKPEIAIYSPNSGDIVNIGDNIVLSTSVNDADGTVSTIQLFANGNLVDEMLNPNENTPLELNWTVDFGLTAELTIVATDNDGDSESATLHLTIADVPTEVYIIKPIDNSSVNTSIIEFEATAMDLNEPIEKVQFLLNDRIIGEQISNSETFKLEWQPDTTGMFTVSAKAITSISQTQTTSSSVTLAIYNAKPTVTITFPTTSDILHIGKPFQIEFTTNDPDGTILKATSFINGIVNEELLNPEEETILSFIAELTSGLQAEIGIQVIDNFYDTVVVSTSVSIFDEPTEISYTTLVDSSTIELAPIDIEVLAYDANEPISKVDFYMRGKLIGTDSEGTDNWQITWTPPTEGVYEITAIATHDLTGTETESEPITLFATTSYSDNRTYDCPSCKKMLLRNVYYLSSMADAQGNLLSQYTYLHCEETYILDDQIFVGNGQFICIAPGTVIKAEIVEGNSNAHALTVTRGGTIYAEGAECCPIIFTTLEDKLDGSYSIANTGKWGGLVILGRAQNSVVRPRQCAMQLCNYVGLGILDGFQDNDTYFESDTRYQFGVDITNGVFQNEESSGRINYVSVRYAGANISPVSTDAFGAAGITLASVGSGTDINFLEVVSPKFDGISIYGGTVNVKYVKSFYSGYQAFAIYEGYTGKVQNLFCVHLQAGNLLEARGRYGIRLGYIRENFPEPIEINPIISNATIIGANTEQTDGGIRVSSSGKGTIYNSIFANFDNGLAGYTESSTATFENNTFSSCSELTNGATPSTSNLVLPEINSFDPFYQIDLVNNYDVASNSADFIPSPSTGAIDAYDLSTVDPWFDPANYRGAFDPNSSPWWNMYDCQYIPRADFQSITTVTCLTDINRDGQTGVADLNMLLINFGFDCYY